MKGPCAVCSLVVVLAGLLQAQSSAGEIVGQVIDESGAAIAEAKIAVRNTETGETRQFSSDGSGNYAITQLIPGTYEISVERGGFRRFVRAGLTLQVGQRARVDVALRVGAVTESVEVVAETPLLESTEASLCQVIENRKILELPLNGRNILSLTALTTGVTPGNSFGIGTAGRARRHDSGASANILINGGMTAHELYDHARDPRETLNLADRVAHRDLVGKLGRMLASGWRRPR